MKNTTTDAGKKVTTVAGKKVTGAPKGERPAIKRAPRPKLSTSAMPGVVALKDWLATLQLGVNPTVHVNGATYSSAFLSVDFGMPLAPVRLSPDEEQELASRIRIATRDVLDRDIKVGVFRDQPHGMWWSCAA